MLMIDRSNVNGHDDYVAAHKAGVTHAYFKVSEGTGFTDTTYHERRGAAHAAGIIVGGYHFASHDSPVAEADHFLGLVGTPPPGHFRPCLDLESGQGAVWASEFVSHVHAKLGYWPVLYGNTSTIPALRAASSAVRACPWWAANYGPNDGQRHALPEGVKPAAHQYTSVARITGITGNTDASVLLDETAMLVATPVKKWPKPDHYRIGYTDKHGDRQHIEPHHHPTIWQVRHPHARDRGIGLHIVPIFKK